MMGQWRLMVMVLVLVLVLVLVCEAVAFSATGTNTNTDTHDTVIPHHAVRRGLSPHHYTGDRSYLHQALLRAVKENQLRVCVVGGSVPFGHGLKNRQEDAWPSRAREHLEDLLAPLRKKHQEEQDEESFTVDVVNLARPAQGSFVQVQTADDSFWTDLETCHVIIVDITVNDSEHAMPKGEAEPSTTLAEGRLLMQTLLIRLVYPNETVSAGRRSSMPVHNMARGLLYFETYTDSPVIKKRAILPGASAKKEFMFDDFRYPDAHKVSASKPTHQSVLPRSSANPSISRNLSTKRPPSKCPFDVTEFRHWPALARYNIPILSWPDVMCHPDVGLGLYDVFPHPHPLYHRYMGRVVGISIFELLLEALMPSLSATRASGLKRIQLARVSFLPMMKNRSNSIEISNHTKTRAVETLVLTEFKNSPFASSDCMVGERLTLLSSRQPLHFQPRDRGGVWVFGEDMLGNDKPGWIAYNKSRDTNLQVTAQKYLEESEIVFDFVSRRNILKIGVLQSRDSRMGTLACCVDCKKFDPTHSFDTHWGFETSVDCLHSITFATVSQVPNLSDIQSEKVSRFLRCRVTFGTKVKITSIVSC